MQCRIFVSDDDITFWEESKISPAITIDSMRDVLRVFVNGQLTGDGSLKYKYNASHINIVFGFWSLVNNIDMVFT